MTERNFATAVTLVCYFSAFGAKCSHPCLQLYNCALFHFASTVSRTLDRETYQSRYPKSRSITPSYTAFSLMLHYAQFKFSCSTLQFYYVHSHTVSTMVTITRLMPLPLYKIMQLTVNSSGSLSVAVFKYFLFFIYAISNKGTSCTQTTYCSALLKVCHV